MQTRRAKLSSKDVSKCRITRIVADRVARQNQSVLKGFRIYPPALPILWNKGYFYRSNNRPSLKPDLSHLIPDTPSSLKIHFHTLQSQQVFSKCPPPPIQNFRMRWLTSQFVHVWYMADVPHSNNIWCTQIMNILIMQCSPSSRQLIPVTFKQSPYTLFPNTVDYVILLGRYNPLALELDI